MFSPFFFYKIFKRFSGWHETLLRELPVISSLLISWAAFSSIQNQHLSFKAPSPACCQMRSIDREVLLWGTNVVFECIRNCKWWKITPKKKIFLIRTQEIPSPEAWLPWIKRHIQNVTKGAFSLIVREESQPVARWGSAIFLRLGPGRRAELVSPPRLPNLVDSGIKGCERHPLPGSQVFTRVVLLVASMRFFWNRVTEVIPPSQALIQEFSPLLASRKTRIYRAYLAFQLVQKWVLISSKSTSI